MKFKKGDLVANLRAGGFGESSQGAKAALVLKAQSGEYELYIVEGTGRETRPESFVDELSEEHKARVMPRLREWLQKLEGYNLKKWSPIYEVREALRLAVK